MFLSFFINIFYEKYLEKILKDFFFTYYMKHSFWNPEDKRSNRRQVLNNYCIKHISEQKKAEKLYRNKKNEMLIRDKNGNLKVVTKNYYLYYMEDDEYDTETELIDPEWDNYVISVQNKYNNNI